MFKNRAFLRSRPLKSTCDCKTTWFVFTDMRCNTVFTGVNFVNEAGAPETDCFFIGLQKRYFTLIKLQLFQNPIFRLDEKLIFN